MEVVVQKMLGDATAHNRMFTAKAAQDLDLWTASLWPVLDSEGVPAAEMEKWQNYAQETRQMISDWILSHSQEAVKTDLKDGSQKY